MPTAASDLALEASVSVAKRRKPKRPVLQPDETRNADILTVVWMLTVVTAFVCELAGMAARLYLGQVPDSVGVQAMFQLLFFSALVIGLISLLMLPAVLKARRTPPPGGVTVFALVVGAAPLVTR